MRNMRKDMDSLYRHAHHETHRKRGSHITVTTKAHSVRFLLISGKPLNEPIAWHAPIVMNTQEELRKAFEEYKAGTFIKAN